MFDRSLFTQVFNDTELFLLLAEQTKPANMALERRLKLLCDATKASAPQQQMPLAPPVLRSSAAAPQSVARKRKRVAPDDSSSWRHMLREMMHRECGLMAKDFADPKYGALRGGKAVCAISSPRVPATQTTYTVRSGAPG